MPLALIVGAVCAAAAVFYARYGLGGAKDAFAQPPADTAIEMAPTGDDTQNEEVDGNDDARDDDTKARKSWMPSLSGPPVYHRVDAQSHSDDDLPG